MDEKTAYEVFKRENLRLPIFTEKALREAVLTFEMSQANKVIGKNQLRYGSLLISFFNCFDYLQNGVRISKQTKENITALFQLKEPGKKTLKKSSLTYVNYFRDLFFTMEETRFPIDCPLGKRQFTPEKVVYQLLADTNRPLTTRETESELESVFCVLGKNLGFSEQETSIKKEIYFPEHNDDDFPHFNCKQLNLFNDGLDDTKTSSNSNQKIIRP